MINVEIYGIMFIEFWRERLIKLWYISINIIILVGGRIEVFKIIRIIRRICLKFFEVIVSWSVWGERNMNLIGRNG